MLFLPHFSIICCDCQAIELKPYPDDFDEWRILKKTDDFRDYFDFIGRCPKCDFYNNSDVET